MKNFILLPLALVLSTCSLAFSLFATEPTFKCLLVSVEKYELAPLDYAENDIGQLAQILMQRYDCQAQACIDSAALLGETGDDVARKSVMRKIEAWCRSLKDDDTALLYLAGHGVKDEAGKLYLAMINFDRQNFETAAIPLEWIRDLFEKASGKSKLLLVDTCFAGTAKSVDFQQADSGDVSGSFAAMKNVVTIASCRANEKSWLWGDAKHSLFTYWLIQAFKGHADLDADRNVTCDELVTYLQDNVSWVARAALDKDQNPIVLNQSAGEGFNLPLRAIALSRLVDDVAELIDLQMRMGKFTRIGVPEFTTGGNRTFDPRYGALPRDVANSLRNSLAAKSRRNRSGYSVLSENSLQKFLRSKGITPADLGTDKTKEMCVEGDDVPILIDGQMTMFESRGLTLRAQLLDTKGISEVGQARGAALLNANELAMSGISAKFGIASNSPPPIRSDLETEPGIGLASASQLAEPQQMLNAAVLPNPLETASSATPTDGIFDVWIETRPIASEKNYAKRAFTFRGNDCYLPLSKGEEYRILFKANCPKDVFVRVMVDGLNSISQPQTTISKGAYVEAVAPGSSGEMVVAPRVPLEKARSWFVGERSSSIFPIEGFVDANGTNDTVRRFRIVDAEESVAARKNYTEQIGLITVAFYEGVESLQATRGDRIGTDMGDAVRIDVKPYEGNKVPGKMIAVYNIRYTTPEALLGLMK